MITASVVIDLADAGEFGTDRRRIFAAGLDHAPDGARVIVLVGSRCWTVDPEAVRLLHQAAERLSLDIRAADAMTATRWRQAVQTGDLFGDAAA